MAKIDHEPKKKKRSDTLEGIWQMFKQDRVQGHNSGSVKLRS